MIKYANKRISRNKKKEKKKTLIASKLVVIFRIASIYICINITQTHTTTQSVLIYVEVFFSVHSLTYAQF